MAFLSKSSDSHSKKGGVPQSTSLQNLPLQTKLRVGRPHDAFEQEADRVADRVVNSPSPKSLTSPASPVAGQISRYVQKQAQEDEQKTVQKQAKPEEDKEAVQKQTKPEEDKEAVQKQAKPEEDKDTVQKQAKPEEDKDTVQKQAKPEEDKEAVQKQTKPEEDKEAVQKQTKPEEEQPDQPKVGGELNDPEVEQRLMASKTGGEPLEPDVLQDMEQRFNTSLSHVRIHRDGTAIDLCNRLNAEAFTHGSHIYFNAGKYNPTSAEGKRLLAHELTHVVQQSDRIEREIIQRANGDDGGGTATATTFQDPQIGSIDTTNKRITIPTIGVPNFKRSFGPQGGFTMLPRGEEERENTQATLWDTEAVKGENFTSQLNQKLRQENSPALTASGGPIYYLKLKRSQDSILLGDANTIKQRTARPTWDRVGNYLTYDVDHKVELQLGGPNAINNLWLLESIANRSSGALIKNEINDRINQVISRAGRANVVDLPSLRTVKQEYSITVDRGVSQGGSVSGRPDKNWELDQIQRGDQLDGLRFLTKQEIQEANLRGSPDELAVYSRQSGGLRARVAWGQSTTQQEGLDIFFGRNLRINSVYYDKSPNGRKAIVVTAFKGNSKTLKSDTTLAFPLAESEAVEWGGYVQRQSILQAALMKLELKSLSPINLTEADLDAEEGLVARGQILPSVPLIRDANIEVIIDGSGARLRKLFDVSEIHLPPPFAIKNTTLEVFVGTEGLGISGRTNLEITGVGEGFIAASASTGGGFDLEGEFNFDSQLFDPARISVTYRDNVFGVSGEIGIPRGKVRGIRSANITVAYTEGTFTANGRAELDIRGVESGTLSATYSAQGWSIGGTFNLSGDIPRIRSGSVSVTVQKVAGEEGYRLTATGTAVPDIPGITSQLTIGYDNGILTIEGQASYSRGLLSGEITVGATNRAVGADGQPTGDPTDRFILYGGGSLTIRITPWLQGTVGVRFQPNGEMIVSGRIGLPSSIEVFRRFGIPEREVFGIGFDIPIFAIPVGPRSIGLVASIRGGLRVYAGIGPGRLERLELGVEYNPAHPEETHVTGGGRFVIPAEAGLRLFVRATIGLSAVIGGVEGGLELAGGLGLEAAAEADVNVDWTPQTGLELNASLSAYVQPKFIFTIDGLIRAWFAFYEKEWRWRLANYEYGPDLRFGVRLPIHYREGEPFDISFDNLEITRPNIDASSFLGGLIRDIRERRG